MGLDFDVVEFCRKLRTSKQPPYECPVPQCGKVYKSLCGLQYHLVNYDHNNPSQTNPNPTPGRKKGRGSTPGRPIVAANAATPTTVTQELLAMPTREGLTYAEAQKMVEFEVDGRITRVNIYDPLPVVSKEEYEATYGSIEGNSAPAVPAEEKVNLPEPCYTILESYNISDAPARPNAYIRFIERSAEELDGEVEYDMDEEDAAWLSIINERRATAGLCEVPVDTFELLMDRLEKESYFQMQSTGKADGAPPAVIDDDAVCCICMDGECQNSNVILFCDMCNLAVHQDCYGVPYIPEGQWLCRRCLQSPSRAVDCVLCPNNGGAFKQTDRGHWAHVVCALWIPEVRFANTVFLEPIDSIETIPPARWKLTCYICKQRGVGACIQCHKTNCYAAFHVTCAQQAGLYMKMDTVRDTSTGAGLDPGPVLVQKTAFCDSHTPADADSRPRIPKSSQSPGSDENSSPSGREKMKKARRLLAKKRSSVPVISIPTIPPERIQEIASLVNLPKKSQLIQRLIAYWTLKRQFRNGVPLLRRLQSSHLARREDTRPLQEVVSDAGELYRQLKFWQCLRQDLERARLLCELVRKREKLKKEFTKVKELCLRLELWPREWLMLRLLDMIQSRDAGDIFSEPVDPSEVPDYSDVVKQPMDLSTMRQKAQSFQYQSLDDLEADFNLMISNCMAYNSRDTIFYRAAIKMRDQGGALIRQARRDMEATGFDPATGLLLPEGQSSQPLEMSDGVASCNMNSAVISSEEGLAAEIDRQVAEVMDRLDHMASREALARLLDLLDRSQRLRHGLARAKRTRLIKAEIAKLRRRVALGQGSSSARACDSGASGSAQVTASEGEDGFESDTEHEDTTDDDASASPRKTTTAAGTTTPSSAVTPTAPAPTPTTTPAPTPEKPARLASRRSTAASAASAASSASELAHGADSSKEEAPSARAATPPPPPPPASGGSSKRGRRKKPGKRPREHSGDARAAAAASPPPSAPKVANLVAAPPSAAAAHAGPASTPSGASATAASSPAAACSTPNALPGTAADASASALSKVSSTISPTTPAKLGVTAEHQAQMTISPSGVNRRTAVLFTRKAQAAAAFRRPEQPGSSTPVTATVAPPTNKRRVGRPRKNLDSALSSKPDPSNSTSASLGHGSGPTGGGSNALTADRGNSAITLGPSPLPFSESFRVYRQGGDIPAETDEDSQSDSSCSSCSTTDGSTATSAAASSSIDLQHQSAGDTSAEDEVPAASARAGLSATGGSTSGNVTSGATSASAGATNDSVLEPLDMVWAKCRGYPWYPALIIDPKMPRTGYLHNGVPIPAPPVDVLALASNYDEPVYLVLFFDTKRTWQWLPRIKLEPLGLSTDVDQSKLTESRKPTERKAVRKAFEEAMTYRCQVAGGVRRARAASTGASAAPSGDDT